MKKHLLITQKTHEKLSLYKVIHNCKSFSETIEILIEPHIEK